ncbi:MAG: DNA gyrase subunit A [Acidimicrobiia bacterium]|nr:DNA gyrase subunit A [Acidimicrobiia bacterium]
MPDETNSSDGTTAAIRPVEIEEEMKHSFMEYSMSVIVSRALPDVRDGLKPVHRRILYGMSTEGMRPDRRHQKCANAVGVVMGRFHPHGDTAIYDSLVRMAQDFAMRHPLIDPKGNFGSIDFPPAAMRYTEARLNNLAMLMLEGIDEDTVDFQANYDGQHEEPAILPARFPNLLVNGSAGIAVGMATNIPPHNLAEVIEATLHVLDNPDATSTDLMQFVKGPDFPTAGQVIGMAGIRDAYMTGRGSIRVRAKVDIEETSTGKVRLVATELPYQVSLQRTAERIAELLKADKIAGITNVLDESDKEGPRLVIELRKDAIPNVVLNNLYKHTQLQETFGANMVALVDGVPRTLSLVDMVSHYVRHQLEVVERRTSFRLRRARERAHIVEGLLLALDRIDEVVALIRSSESVDDARTALMQTIGVSETQANHILDMPLRRLAALEVGKLRDELVELQATIAALQAILDDPTRLRAVVKDELNEAKEKHADPRRTVILPDEDELDIEDLIADEDLVVTVTRRGFIKSVLEDSYRLQGRGGKGVIGGRLRDEDHVEHMLTTTAHAYLLLFTNRGKVYRIKAHEIPKRDRTARGVALPQFLPVGPDERVQAIIDTRDYETARYLAFVTRHGVVKKTRFQEYDSSRRDGLIAIGLKDDDELVSAFTTSGEDDIIVVTRDGMGIRFAESDVRPMGRTAGGVRAIAVAAGDVVVGARRAEEECDVLLVTERGYGKRTHIADFRPQRRGGKGLIAMKVAPNRGRLMAARTVRPEDDLLLINSTGTVVRINAGQVSVQGRQATGVKLMALGEGEEVTAVALAAAQD